MNHHDVRPIGDARECIRDGILTTGSASDNFDRLPAREQKCRRRLDHLGRDRHHEIVDHIAVPEDVDTPFENRSSTKREELLWLRGAEAQATAAGRDEGRHMQGV